MSVITALETGLYSKLAAGSALITALGGTAIYSMQAPDNSVPPYVVFNLVFGQPENITPSDMRSQLYQVRAFAYSKATAGTLDALIDALLHRQALTVSGYTNFWSVRETDAPALVENLPSGIRVYSFGGYYRFRLDD